MRRLVVVTVLLALLWAGGWHGAVRLAEMGAERALARAGQDVDAGSIQISGFPWHFALAATDVVARDQGHALEYRAAALRVEAPAWAPWHVTLSLPAPQIVDMRGRSVTLSGDDMAARLRVAPRWALPLDGAAFEGAAIDLDAGTTGWLRADDVHVDLHALSGRDAFALDFRLAGLSARAGGVALATDIPPDGNARVLPPIGSLEGELFLRPNMPIDRFADPARLALDEVELRDVTADWQGVVLVANGRIAPDVAGLAAGEVTLRIDGAGRLVERLVLLGVIPEKRASLVAHFLRTLGRMHAAAGAGEGGNDEKGAGAEDAVQLPLVLKDGLIRLGPVPLGRAPVMDPARARDAPPIGGAHP